MFRVPIRTELDLSGIPCDSIMHLELLAKESHDTPRERRKARWRIFRVASLYVSSLLKPLGSVWDRFGVGLGSVRGRFGVPGSLEAGFCL